MKPCAALGEGSVDSALGIWLSHESLDFKNCQEVHTAKM